MEGHCRRGGHLPPRLRGCGRATGVGHCANRLAAIARGDRSGTCRARSASSGIIDRNRLNALLAEKSGSNTRQSPRLLSEMRRIGGGAGLTCRQVRRSHRAELDHGSDDRGWLARRACKWTRAYSCLRSDGDQKELWTGGAFRAQVGRRSGTATHFLRNRMKAKFGPTSNEFCRIREEVPDAIRLIRQRSQGHSRKSDRWCRGSSPSAVDPVSREGSKPPGAEVGSSRRYWGHLPSKMRSRISPAHG